MGLRPSDSMSWWMSAGASTTTHSAAWSMMYPLVETCPPVYEMIGMEE